MRERGQFGRLRAGSVPPRIADRASQATRPVSPSFTAPHDARLPASDGPIDLDDLLHAAGSSNATSQSGLSRRRTCLSRDGDGDDPSFHYRHGGCLFASATQSCAKSSQRMPTRSSRDCPRIPVLRWKYNRRRLPGLSNSLVEEASVLRRDRCDSLYVGAGWRSPARRRSRIGLNPTLSEERLQTSGTRQLNSRR